MIEGMTIKENKDFKTGAAEFVDVEDEFFIEREKCIKDETVCACSRVGGELRLYLAVNVSICVEAYFVNICSACEIWRLERMDCVSMFAAREIARLGFNMNLDLER